MYHSDAKIPHLQDNEMKMKTTDTRTHKQKLFNKPIEHNLAFMQKVQVQIL